MKRALIVPVAVGLVLAVTLPTNAVSRQYIAGVGDLTSVNCAGDTASALPAIGGACFEVPAGAPYMRVQIADALERPVAAEFYFRDAADEAIVSGRFCSDRATRVPPGAVSVDIYVPTVFAPLDCGLVAWPGTTGEIIVDWVDSADPAPVAATAGSGSPNVKPVANISHQIDSQWPFPGGTDLEFFTNLTPDGPRRYAVTGSYQNGIRIIDITAPTTPVVVARYDCDIFQADIQIFSRQGRRYVALGVDDFLPPDVSSDCYRDVGYESGTVYGTFILDVTDPAAPTTVSFLPFEKGSHNTTIDPSGFYLYNSNADLPALGQLEVFDLTDLAHPTVAHVLKLGPSLPSHDVTFSQDGSRAYVAALTSTVILDTTDVANPRIIGRIIDPAINIHHQADPITLEDPILGLRTFLLVTDEIAGAEGNGVCPGGAIHVFDITGPLEKTPLPVGVFEVPDTRPIENRLRCTAHVMRMYPDQKLMTIAWYTAGVRVLDLSGLAGVSAGTEATGSVGVGIKQIGWFAFDKTDTWAVKAPPDAFEPNGSFYMYGSDQLRGFDVYRFDATAPQSPATGLWLTPEEARARLGLPATAPLSVRTVSLYCVVRPAA